MSVSPISQILSPLCFGSEDLALNYCDPTSNLNISQATELQKAETANFGFWDSQDIRTNN